MIDELGELKRIALEAIGTVTTLEGLEEWRVRFIGRKGELAGLLKNLATIPAEQRRSIGEASNITKTTLEEAFTRRQLTLKEESMARALTEEKVDVTQPGRRKRRGHYHPITRTIREINEIFQRMGFSILETREVELDDYNFRRLNFPELHPSRDMHDTFFISEDLLLRTHTSPGQVHAMEKWRPEPIRAILPGKTYRYEAVDATHFYMFHQMEGIAIGHNITMGDLKGSINTFARAMFGPQRKSRLRASYFPFTEPSMEVDIDCFNCEGKGCNICKFTGWIEIGGSGMINPNVLRMGGYDPAEYSGFAFGLGVERIAVLKYGIEGIRLFYNNDLRFLEQF